MHSQPEVRTKNQNQRSLFQQERANLSHRATTAPFQGHRQPITPKHRQDSRNTLIFVTWIQIKNYQYKNTDILKMLLKSGLTMQVKYTAKPYSINLAIIDYLLLPSNNNHYTHLLHFLVMFLFC